MSFIPLSRGRVKREEVIKMIKRTIASFVAALALLVNASGAVLAQSVVLEISGGNGAGSDNDIVVNMEQTTGVKQSNSAVVVNNVVANSNTGGNTADRNTGGDTGIETGDATSEVGVQNTLNSNQADVSGCGTCGEAVEATISGNGADTDNDIVLNLGTKQREETDTYVSQNNFGKVVNNVVSNAGTGNNQADRNTGGSVYVSTGDATSTAGVVNTLNANSAFIGGNGSGNGLSALIAGNGAGSDNDIVLNMDRGVLVDQDNFASVWNNIGASAFTGGNSANRNTSGMVSIETGDATTTVGVDTMANFNYADIDCECLMGVNAKVGANGADSNNTIRATLGGGNWLTQDNNAGGFPFWFGGFNNKVTADAVTGVNGSDYNGGGANGDPDIDTGNSVVTVGVENTGNVNVYGDMMPDSILDELPFSGITLNISFDLGDFLDWLMSA